MYKKLGGNTIILTAWNQKIVVGGGNRVEER